MDQIYACVSNNKITAIRYSQEDLTYHNTIEAILDRGDTIIPIIEDYDFPENATGRAPTDEEMASKVTGLSTLVKAVFERQVEETEDGLIYEGDESYLVQMAPYDKDATYRTGDLCTIIENGSRVIMQMYYGPNQTMSGISPSDSDNRHEDWDDDESPFYWIPYNGNQVGIPNTWLSETPPEYAVLEQNTDLPVAVYWRLGERYPDLVFKSKGDYYINTGDIMGKFIRIWDKEGDMDEDRDINTHQDDAFQGHFHDAGNIQSRTKVGSKDFGQDGNQSYTDSKVIFGPITDGDNGTPRVSHETRGVNWSRAGIINI